MRKSARHGPAPTRTRTRPHAPTRVTRTRTRAAPANRATQPGRRVEAEARTRLTERHTQRPEKQTQRRAAHTAYRKISLTVRRASNHGGAVASSPIYVRACVAAAIPPTSRLRAPRCAHKCSEVRVCSRLRRLRSWRLMLLHSRPRRRRPCHAWFVRRARGRLLRARRAVATLPAELTRGRGRGGSVH